MEEIHYNTEYLSNSQVLKWGGKVNILYGHHTTKQLLLLPKKTLNTLLRCRGTSTFLYWYKNQ